MAILETVKAPEQWLVEVNGGYDILFTEATLADAAVDGEVIQSPVNGIVSGGGEAGDIVRVMVRGNPSKVDGDKIVNSSGSTLPSGIVVL